MNLLDYVDFEKIDLRTGTIIEVKDFDKARKPAYQIWIDFGKLGIKKSSAQITKLYTKDQLIGKQIVAVVNFEPRQIANFMSECLILGFENSNKEVTLLVPDSQILNGTQVL